MHWAKMREAGGLTGMRFLLGVYRVCGRWPFRFLLFFVLLWFYARRRVAREASREYLQRLYAFSGGATPTPTRRNVFRHFLAYSEILLDKLLATNASGLSKPFRIDGAECVQPLLEQKRGAVFISAHFGNIELCRKLSERYTGVRLTVLAHTKNAARFTRLMKERDPDYDVDLIQVDDIGIDTAIALAQRIDAGGFVMITGDRVPTGSATATVRIPFLGHEASFPISPYVLAATLQCSLFAVFGARHGDGFVITLRQFAETLSLPRRARETAIVPYALAFAGLLEAECRKTPFQWSNFYPFWALSAPVETEEPR
ncbi:MAG: acyltransferase [Burkholderiales bacterium]|jgi:predicted LPLAT superfamily acyltransferase|nr:acyltransferase [Burkholderiales bacterium]